MKYCFVILHYQSIDDTLSCIESIKKLSGQHEIKIVIIDNASPNGSGALLQSKYTSDDQILYIANDHNVGFSAANNKACLAAKEKWNPDFYVIANNDITFIQADIAERISEIYDNTGFSVLGPDIYNARRNVHQSPLDNDPPSAAQARKTVLLNRLALAAFPVAKYWLRRYFKTAENVENKKDWDKQQRDVCLMGACLIFSKDFIDSERGAFFPETGFYYEEYILSLRCRRAGGIMVYDPSLQVYHESGSATKAGFSIADNALRFKLKNISDSAKIYFEYLVNK